MAANSRRIAETSSRGSGFTLIEVICAVAIIAIALVPLLRAQSLAIRASGASQKITVATLLARSLMTEIQLELFPDIGQSNGDFSEQGYPEFTYEVDIRTPEDLESLLRSFGAGLTTENLIREVELNIYWNEELRWSKTRPRSFTLTAWIINQGQPRAPVTPWPSSQSQGQTQGQQTGQPRGSKQGLQGKTK